MKAIVFDAYGTADVLRLADVPDPMIGDEDLLVEVRAASVNPIDWHFMTGLPYVARVQFGLRRPKVRQIGADLAGVVIDVGEHVTSFQPGDHVYGGVPEGPHGRVALGSCAEFVRVTEATIAPKPAAMTFEQVATVPVAGLTALQALRDHGRLRAGQHVLCNGASGGVGTFAIQIAKAMGAEVTGVCSARNVDLVRSIGADHVIDYTRDDFTRGDRRYDLILDNIGNHSVAECRRVLEADGTYVASFGRPGNKLLGPMGQLMRMSAVNPFVKQRLVTFVTSPNRADLVTMNEWLEAGVVTPVIDRTFSLVETADAMRHLDTGHARGKIVVTI